MTRIGIIGGGPGGYEAALVAAQLGAEVTVVDRDGLGGSAVLTDCVPSKTLIATAEVMTDTAESGELGRADRVRRRPRTARSGVDLARVNARVTGLAQAQSDDIAARLEREGVRVRARARAGWTGRPGWSPSRSSGGTETVEVDTVLVVDRCAPAGAARRAARRRADPDLGAALHARPSSPSTSSWWAPA